MTINDIKIATLQLMFANYDEDLNGSDVDEITNPQYAKYTVNMNASINRAIGRIENAKVLPVKRLKLSIENGEVEGSVTRWNLLELASDFLAIHKVIQVSRNYVYNPNGDWSMEGDTIVMPTPSDGESYVILYYRRIPRISLIGSSAKTIDLPDNVAEIIPYWVKADLYEEDEPNLATLSRNIFEQLLADLSSADREYQSSVKNVFWGID